MDIIFMAASLQFNCNLITHFTHYIILITYIPLLKFSSLFYASCLIPLQFPICYDQAALCWLFVPDAWQHGWMNIWYMVRVDIMCQTKIDVEAVSYNVRWRIVSFHQLGGVTGDPAWCWVPSMFFAGDGFSSFLQLQCKWQFIFAVWMVSTWSFVEWKCVLFNLSCKMHLKLLLWGQKKMVPFSLTVSLDCGTNSHPCLVFCSSKLTL